MDRSMFIGQTPLQGLGVSGGMQIFSE